MIDVKIFNVTVLMTNCCLLTDRKTGKMAVTDPGAPNEELNSEIEKNGGKAIIRSCDGSDKEKTA